MIPVRHLQGVQIINPPFLFPSITTSSSPLPSPFKLFSESSIICSLHLNLFHSILFLVFNLSLVFSYFLIVPVALDFSFLFILPPSSLTLSSTLHLPSTPSLFSCPWRTLLPFCLVSRGSPTPTPMGSVPWLSPLWQVCQVCVCAARW